MLGVLFLAVSSVGSLAVQTTRQTGPLHSRSCEGSQADVVEKKDVFEVATERYYINVGKSWHAAACLTKKKVSARLQVFCCWR
jgi:hypothetical protein